MPSERERRGHSMQKLQLKQLPGSLAHLKSYLLSTITGLSVCICLHICAEVEHDGRKEKNLSTLYFWGDGTEGSTQ